MFYQQGDVLLFLEKEIPIEGKEIKTNILQEGEATGHAHRLFGNDLTVFETKNNEKYLRIVKPTLLKHEEHKEFTIPPGAYRVGIVREYDHFKEEARYVAD